MRLGGSHENSSNAIREEFLNIVLTRKDKLRLANFENKGSNHRSAVCIDEIILENTTTN